MAKKPLPHGQNHYHMGELQKVILSGSIGIIAVKTRFFDYGFSSDPSGFSDPYIKEVLIHFITEARNKLLELKFL